MHWLQFLAYFLVVLAFFALIWKALDHVFGTPTKEPIRQGRVFAKEDFEIFGEEAPIFLWPLKEDDEVEHRRDSEGG